jgi:hypothetical protein
LDPAPSLGYIRQHARPIDRALAAWHFVDDPAAAVVEAVGAYQNDDGGFGHAVEPDFRVPDSSVTATTVAFQYLDAIDAPLDHPVVRAGVAYLVATFDERTRSWPPVCPAIVDHPRAPWWNFYPPIPFDPADPQWGNPNVEAAGWLARFAGAEHQEFVRGRLDEAVEWSCRVRQPEPHALACATRLAHVLETVDPERAASVWPALIERVREAVGSDPDRWQGYTAQPLWFASNPASPIVRAIPTLFDASVDLLAAGRGEDGAWLPTWQWSGFPEVWRVARHEWIGKLTVDGLVVLDRFGRLQGQATNR